MFFGKYRIDECERNKRMNCVNYATASVELSGGSISPALKLLGQMYVNGQFTPEEYQYRTERLVQIRLRKLKVSGIKLEIPPSEYSAIS